MRILLYYRKEDYSRDCLNIFQSNFLKSSLHSYFDVLGFDGIVSPKRCNYAPSPCLYR